ncbi:MAG: MauE/DoxX family redox-associated membrane protein [Bacteroidota bacterium]
MTLTKLLIGVALFAIVLTALQKVMDRKLIKNYLLSFLQNFVGGIFIFSGMVKAVDPLGTAYKMEQYFAEFETTFAATKAAFLAPMFPALAEYAIAFSVFMIVFEIFLGITLLVGAWRKFTAWAYFLLVVFFTFLTGFTYLTGYVPEGVNFFQFAQWTAFETTNMKVTDCGCFGDFLKLEPYVSFWKDIFLLIPGVIFLFGNKSFHQLTTGNQRALSIGLALALTLIAIFTSGYSLGWRVLVFALTLTGVQYLSKNAALMAGIVALTLYCFSNYITDIPEVDFRPFNVGKNVAERKALEEESENNVKVLAYKMTNKTSGEIVELPFDQYLQDYAKYPTEEWELDQIKSEPEVERSKISDFEVSGSTGNDLTEGILSEEGPHLMIVAYRLYGSETTRTTTVPDSIFVNDTIVNALDTTIETRLASVNQKEVQITDYSWDEDYLAKWKTEFLPEMELAAEQGLKVYAVTAYSSPERITAFQEALGTNIPFFNADDILLKTIVRSNPGPVLWENGSVIMKWHHKTMPPFAEMQENYLK